MSITKAKGSDDWSEKTNDEIVEHIIMYMFKFEGGWILVESLYNTHLLDEHRNLIIIGLLQETGLLNVKNQGAGTYMIHMPPEKKLLIEKSGGSYAFYKQYVDAEKYIITERQARADKKERLEIKQIQSVIDTNDSVQRSNLWIPLLTGALVLISIFGLVREIIKDRQKPEIEQLLKQQTIILDSLSKNLQRIDSSFRNKKIDSSKKE